jgi:hypothetical protein
VEQKAKTISIVPHGTFLSSIRNDFYFLNGASCGVLTFALPSVDEFLKNGK